MNDQLETFPLDEPAIEVIQALHQQILALNERSNGVLLLFIRQHELQGTWRIAPNLKEIVRLPDPVTVPQ